MAREHDAGDTPNLTTVALVRMVAGSDLGDAVADTLLQAGGTDVRHHAGDDDAQVVCAHFLRVTDATRAAVHLAGGGVGVGPDVPVVTTGANAALCTGEPDPPDAEAEGPLLSRATALLGHALPGQVLVNMTAAVLGGRSLPRGVELVDHGNVGLAPGDPPERVYRLRVEGDVPRDQRIGSSNLEWARRTVEGPVVGYDEPVATLLKAWKGVLDGGSRMVLLSGDEGPAATLVAAEAALRLHAEGAQVLYGRWDRRTATSHEALREALGIHADGCSVETLRADLDGWSDEIGRLLPDVAVRAGGRPPRPAEPHVARSLLARAIEAWLEAVARRRPTLLVLDDLHRADAASLPLLDALRHGRGRGPLLILVTANLTPGDPASVRLETFATEADSAGFDHISLRPGL